MSRELADLLRKRLVFVTGKGGVGKSTCSLGLALAAAKEGKRVLLCEFGARSASGDYLEVPAVNHEPHQPLAKDFPGLWVARLDTHLALQEYFAETLKLGPLVRLATENRVLSRLWKIAPSVDEIVLLNALYHYERGTHRSGLKHLDLIIVDMPATGHALSMFGVPRGVTGLSKLGPLGKRCEALDAMLSDKTKSAYCIVTLAEELPVNESIQLSNDLRSNLQLETTHILINRVLSYFIGEEDLGVINGLRACVQGKVEKNILKLASDNATLRKLQAHRISDLKTRIEACFVEIQHFPEFGRQLIERIAGELISSFNQGRG